jgi:aryl-alcohol dehydrogenase-like predicted oxidoreductase
VRVDIEHEIAPVAGANDVALMDRSPLSGGYLSGKYTPDGGNAQTGRRANRTFPSINAAKVDPIVLELREVAAALETTPARVALARVLGVVKWRR